MLEYFKKEKEKHDLSLLVNMQKQKKKKKKKTFVCTVILNSSGFNKLNLQQNFTHLGAPRRCTATYLWAEIRLIYVSKARVQTCSCSASSARHCLLLLLPPRSCVFLLFVLHFAAAFLQLLFTPSSCLIFVHFFSLASDPVQWVHYTSDVWKYHWTVAIFPYTELKKKSRYVFGGRYRRCFGPSLTKLSTDVYLNRKNKPAAGRDGSNLEKSHLLAGALLASSGEYWWVS